MDNENYLEDFLESILEYRKVVLIINIFPNDRNFSREIGLSERDINRLNLEFKNILKEQHEKYLAYVKNEEESVIEKFYYE